ncbi:MAG: type IV-A pilus assembly ATPase PilB [bacterium]
MVQKLGELLVRENYITASDLQQALEEQKKHGGRLGANLTRLGLIQEEELADFLSKQFGVPSINLSEVEIDREVINLVSEELARKHSLIPITRAGPTLVVAMADPSNMFAVSDLEFYAGFKVDVVVAPENAINDAIDKYYADTGGDIAAGLDWEDFEGMDVELGGEEEDEVNIGDLEKASEDAPVIRLVNMILTDAIKKNASDIHVEPYEKAFRVRYRIDGILYEVMKPPMKLKNPIVARVKIMANLNIAEKRLPQDGRIKIKMGKNQEMDYRVSVLPTLFGEKVVCRLLDKSNLELDMTKLGFFEEQLGLFQTAIRQPYGMVLVTGPTGSGKTTTLYSALSELNKTTTNISTAEDPVEFNLMGINQVQMKEEIGLNFASALRSFLRQDPDIIMVGEIRDFETAEIAVKAALTGHLVLSTLHTNDAPSTVNRLLNMGVEPFLVASSVNVIQAQRLSRKNCPECSVPVEIEAATLTDLGMSEEEAQSCECRRGEGCHVCNETGYKGRIALSEVMYMYDDLKEFVLNGASSAELKSEARRLGMLTLRESGLKRIAEGMTTPEEVLRATASD